jgi:hypothetical protein
MLILTMTVARASIALSTSFAITLVTTIMSAQAKDIYIAPKSYKIIICNTDKPPKCIVIDLAKMRDCKLYPKYCDID